MVTKKNTKLSIITMFVFAVSMVSGTCSPESGETYLDLRKPSLSLKVPPEYSGYEVLLGLEGVESNLGRHKLGPVEPMQGGGNKRQVCGLPGCSLVGTWELVLRTEASLESTEGEDADLDTIDLRSGRIQTKSTPAEVLEKARTFQTTTGKYTRSAHGGLTQEGRHTNNNVLVEDGKLYITEPVVLIPIPAYHSASPGLQLTVLQSELLNSLAHKKGSEMSRVMLKLLHEHFSPEKPTVLQFDRYEYPLLFTCEPSNYLLTGDDLELMITEVGKRTDSDVNSEQMRRLVITPDGKIYEVLQRKLHLTAREVIPDLELAQELKTVVSKAK